MLSDLNVKGQLKLNPDMEINFLMEKRKSN